MPPPGGGEGAYPYERSRMFVVSLNLKSVNQGVWCLFKGNQDETQLFFHVKVSFRVHWKKIIIKENVVISVLSGI